jgi:hypothetical protein
MSGHQGNNNPAATNDSQANNTPPVDPTTHYLVYRAVYTMPNMGIRHAIYVESQAWFPQSGTLFQVVGDPSTGPATFRVRDCRNPLNSPGGESITRVGWVFHNGHVQAIQQVCQTVTTPGQQTNGPPPPRNCSEWVTNAIAALRTAGVLQPLQPSDSTETVFRTS